MNGIIKLRDTGAASVRSLSTARTPAGLPAVQEPAVDPELMALRLETDSLQQQLKQRDIKIVQLEADVDAAFKTGRAQGRTEGLAEAEDLQAKSLARLEGGIDRAAKLFAAEISSLERLAALLAQESLAKILEDRTLYADLLKTTIRAQIARIEAQSILKVEVSPADFADAAQLADLAAAVARPELEIRASDELAAGDCRIRLKLGTLEVGIGQQWARLDAALSDLADPGEAV